MILQLFASKLHSGLCAILRSTYCEDNPFRDLLKRAPIVCACLGSTLVAFPTSYRDQQHPAWSPWLKTAMRRAPGRFRRGRWRPILSTSRADLAGCHRRYCSRSTQQAESPPARSRRLHVRGALGAVRVNSVLIRGRPTAAGGFSSTEPPCGVDRRSMAICHPLVVCLGPSPDDGTRLLMDDGSLRHVPARNLETMPAERMTADILA